MKIQQISVFLENKAGRLAEVTKILTKADINIRALSLADTSDFGILRLILSDHKKAEQALKDGGFTVGLTDVIALQVPDVPGGLHCTLQLLEKNGVNVEYMYAFAHHDTNAALIFRFNDIDKGIAVLKNTQDVCILKL